MTFLIMLGIGLAAGVLSGLFGIGGGIVIVPSLMLLVGMAPHMATGTSLGVLVLPVVSLGAWTYYKNGNLEPKASLLIALGLFCGSWIGAQLAHGLAPDLLRRLFALLLVAMAVRLWFTS